MFLQELQPMNLNRTNILWAVLGVLLVVRGALFMTEEHKQVPLTYTAHADTPSASSTVPVKPAFTATHLKTPDAVKALYMTSWIAGSKNLRNRVLDLTTTTEVNALVIDIKDYTGRISYKVTDPKLIAVGSVEDRVPDMRELIASLHAKGVYVIGRISSFQDSYLAEKRPDLAVQSVTNGGPWKDRNGVMWLDASNQEVWDYLIAIAKDAYNEGFDEVNFDYIRFPSDGNLEDMKFTSFNQASTTKAAEIKDFFSYLHANLAGTGLVTSADLFGLTTSSNDDLGIGQVLENALPYFDFVDPMVYPSHYPPNFNGYKNPAAVPYEIISYAMQKAIEKTVAASSTPAKIRPWLQDFNLGAVYTADMIRKQKQAVYDSGLTSWLMWSAANKYTADGLDPKPAVAKTEERAE
jgi:hypothetical protein